MAKQSVRIPSREAVAHALREEMERSEYLRSQAALARRSGVAQSTIGRILRAEVDAQANSLHRLARALGVPAGRLFGDRAAGGGISSESSPVSSVGGDVTPITDGVVHVPLLARDQLRTIVRTRTQARVHEREEPPIEPDSWLLCPKKCGRHTFALRVEGAAMAGYNHGEIIFCDPDVEPTAGRLVIALMHTDNVVFRQLIVEGNRRYLRATNQDWPGTKITSLEPDDMIVGVVIGKWVDA